MLTKTGSLFFQLLASKHCKGGSIALAKLLPAPIAQSIMASPSVNSKEPELLLQSRDNQIKFIHYSWFIEPFKKNSTSFKTAVLASLPQEISSSLATHCAISTNPLPHYSDTIKTLVLEAFFKQFATTDPQAELVMPRALLPATDLGPMLTLTKLELVEVIDRMSMFDLADEVRHVVDRKLLQMIVGRLNQKTQRFLRSCMSQKTKLALAPMHIEQIYKDEKQFQSKLHKRGIQRLSIALSGQGVDFIWHLVHTLDTGRSHLLSKQIQQQAQPTTPAAKMQLMVVLQYMKDMRQKT